MNIKHVSSSCASSCASSSSYMALQSNTDLRLLNGILPVSSGFWLLFPVFNLHLLISVCTQFHHLFFGRPLSPLPWEFLFNTRLTFIFPPILLTWPIQFYRLIRKNKVYLNLQTATLILYYIAFSSFQLKYLLYATFAVVDVCANYGFCNEAASNLVMVRKSTHQRDTHGSRHSIVWRKLVLCQQCQNSWRKQQKKKKN
jgi:hypothetical protein